MLVAAGRMGPRATRPLRHRPTLAAVTGLAVLATVGLVANDSSVAVPLTMLIVVGPAGILQAVAPAARDRATGGRRPTGRPDLASAVRARGRRGATAGGAGVVIRPDVRARPLVRWPEPIGSPSYTRKMPWTCRW